MINSKGMLHFAEPHSWQDEGALQLESDCAIPSCSVPWFRWSIQAWAGLPEEGSGPVQKGLHFTWQVRIFSDTTNFKLLLHYNVVRKPQKQRAGFTSINTSRDFTMRAHSQLLIVSCCPEVSAWLTYLTRHFSNSQHLQEGVNTVETPFPHCAGCITAWRRSSPPSTTRFSAGSQRWCCLSGEVLSFSCCIDWERHTWIAKGLIIISLSSRI